MDTGQCICHALMKSLCLPCQVKVHLMHLTASPHDHLDTILSASASERSRSPCSPGRTQEHKHSNCTNCEYYVDIISKLTAGVCEDDFMKIVMSSIVDSSSPGDNLLTARAKKTGSECKASSANTVAAVLRGQEICTANSTKKLMSCLKSETFNEPTCDDLVSNFYETRCQRVSTSNSGFPFESSRKKASNDGSSKSENEGKKNKAKSTVQEPTSHVRKVKPVSNSKGDKEGSMMGKYDNNYREVKRENREYKGSGEDNNSSPKETGQHRAQNLSNKNSKNPNLARTNFELDERANYLLPDGVIKNIRSENKESRRCSIENNERDELDEKIDRCLERFYRERMRSPRHHRCSKSPCHRHSNPSGTTCTNSRLVRSAHTEFSTPVSVAIRSRSCGNIDGDSYDELISFNSFPDEKKTRSSDKCPKPAERNLIYNTNLDGQCTSMVIGLPGEDLEMNPERNILINLQRKMRNSPSCSPSRVDKGEQTSGYTDASTQYETANSGNRTKNPSLASGGALWVVTEKVGSAGTVNLSADRIKQGNRPVQGRVGRQISPSGKARTGKQGSTGSPRSTGKQPSTSTQSSGKQGSLGKQDSAGKQTSVGNRGGSSTSRVSSNKTQTLRQTGWKK